MGRGLEPLGAVSSASVPLRLWSAKSHAAVNGQPVSSPPTCSAAFSVAGRNRYLGLVPTIVCMTTRSCPLAAVSRRRRPPCARDTSGVDCLRPERKDWTRSIPSWASKMTASVSPVIPHPRDGRHPVPRAEHPPPVLLLNPRKHRTQHRLRRVLPSPGSLRRRVPPSRSEKGPEMESWGRGDTAAMAAVSSPLTSA